MVFSQTSFLSSCSHILEKENGAGNVLARRPDLNEKAIKEPSVVLPWAGRAASILNNEELLPITIFSLNRQEDSGWSSCSVFLLHCLLYDSELTVHVGVRADIVEAQWFLFNNALQFVFT